MFTRLNGLRFGSSDDNLLLPYEPSVSCSAEIPSTTDSGLGCDTAWFCRWLVTNDLHRH